MIAVIIIFLAVIVISASLSNGQWEVAALFGGIAVLLLLMGAGERHDTRAYLNWLDYWADGVPPGQRQRAGRQRTERASRVTKREREEAAAKREAYIERTRGGTRNSMAGGSAFVCHYCGRFVKASSDVAYTSEGKMRIYRCPECGRQNMTKI